MRIQLLLRSQTLKRLTKIGNKATLHTNFFVWENLVIHEDLRLLTCVRFLIVVLK